MSGTGRSPLGKSRNSSGDSVSLSRLAPPAQALRVSRDFAVLVPSILAVTQQDIEAAWDLMLRYPGLYSRDYIHAAMMLNNGISRILSADVLFDAVAEIERIPPERFAA